MFIYIGLGIGYILFIGEFKQNISSLLHIHILIGKKIYIEKCLDR